MRNAKNQTLFVILAAGATACGGGGGGGSTPVSPPVGGPTTVEKNFSIEMSEAVVRRPSNDELLAVDISELRSSGTLTVTE